MMAQMLMKHNLKVELFSGDSTMAGRVFFMDELDGEHRLVGVQWNGFLDAASLSTLARFRSHRIYHA